MHTCNIEDKWRGWIVSYTALAPWQSFSGVRKAMTGSLMDFLVTTTLTLLCMGILAVFLIYNEQKQHILRDSIQRHLLTPFEPCEVLSQNGAIFLLQCTQDNTNSPFLIVTSG